MSFYQVDDGFEVIGELGYGGGWEWNVFQLAKGEDGQLYYRWGSGCSCNSISEYDYTPINAHTWDQFVGDVHNFSEGSAADKTELIALASRTKG